jgi:hypothetical protein
MEDEGTKFYYEFMWAWELLSAKALVPIRHAGLRTIHIAWAGVDWVRQIFGWEIG